MNVPVSIDMCNKVLRDGDGIEFGLETEHKEGPLTQTQDSDYVLQITEHLPQRSDKWVSVLYQSDFKSDSLQTQREKWQSAAYLIFI